jgi:hypothetical protein
MGDRRKVKDFGKQVPCSRPGQPSGVAPVYVALAADGAIYVSGVTVVVTAEANASVEPLCGRIMNSVLDSMRCLSARRGNGNLH